jgi:hypothetical protein
MAYNIFISHVWDAQNDFYHGLIRLLVNAQRFGFRDLSVPKIRYLDGEQEAVKERILSVLRTADVVLVVNTSAVSKSDFVKSELSEAEKCGIPIIAINTPKRLGPRNRSQHEAILRARKAQWTTKSIVETIKEAVKANRRTDAASSRFAAEAYYAPLAEVIAEEAPLTEDEILQLSEDDVIENASPVHLQAERPRDVVFKEREILQPLASPRRSWLAKLFAGHG